MWRSYSVHIVTQYFWEIQIANTKNLNSNQEKRYITLCLLNDGKVIIGNTCKCVLVNSLNVHSFFKGNWTLMLKINLSNIVSQRSDFKKQTFPKKREKNYSKNPNQFMSFFSQENHNTILTTYLSLAEIINYQLLFTNWFLF